MSNSENEEVDVKIDVFEIDGTVGAKSECIECHKDLSNIGTYKVKRKIFGKRDERNFEYEHYCPDCEVRK